MCLKLLLILCLIISERPVFLHCIVLLCDVRHSVFILICFWVKGPAWELGGVAEAGGQRCNGLTADNITELYYLASQALPGRGTHLPPA